MSFSTLDMRFKRLDDELEPSGPLPFARDIPDPLQVVHNPNLYGQSAGQIPVPPGPLEIVALQTKVRPYKFLIGPAWICGDPVRWPGNGLPLFDPVNLAGVELNPGDILIHVTRWSWVYRSAIYVTGQTVDTPPKPITLTAYYRDGQIQGLTQELRIITNVADAPAPYNQPKLADLPPFQPNVSVVFVAQILATGDPTPPASLPPSGVPPLLFLQSNSVNNDPGRPYLP